MKGGLAALSLRYATRSLRRGGRRTVLAIFCVAVGVMAIVALRLAGDMIDASLTGDIRQVNGGDVSVQSTALPLDRSQLSVLDDLRRRGLVSRYAALAVEQATIRRGQGRIVQLFPLYGLDDPAGYPLVGDAGLVRPAGTREFSAALRRPGSIVLSAFAAEQAGNLSPGETIHLTVVGGRGADLTVTGITANRLSVNGSSVGYVAESTLASIEQRAETYGLVNIVTPTPEAADTVAAELRAQLPGTTVQTVHQALMQNIQASQQIREYLQIVGLLALLIGGIGIVNTVQVLLSRRRIEIATLKTVGYTRLELYALFGVETALLGLVGGLLGTLLGTGLSRLLSALIERLVNIPLVFRVSPGVLATGIAVGVAVSLIFGLLPIVQASAVRPQAVLRDLPEGRDAGSRIQTAVLYLLLLLLFTGLAASLLDDLGVAVRAVLGTAVAITALAGLFSLLLAGVGRLPVPEGRPRRFIGLVTLAVLGAAAVCLAAPAVGAALLVAAVAGYGVLLLPRRQRNSLKLALRSLGRGRARTASTLVALFAGVFTVGLILVLGQDISAKIDQSLAQLATYDVFAIASPPDAAAVESVSRSLPGLQQRKLTVDTQVQPVSVRGLPLSALAQPDPSRPGAQFRFAQLSGVEGYDLAAGALPETDAAEGRTLSRTDAGSNAVMVRTDLRKPPFSLRTGDALVVRGRTGGPPRTLTVVGFYAPVSGRGSQVRFKFFFQPLLVDSGTARALGGAQLNTIVSLRVDPAHKLDALRRLEGRVPSATVYDLSDLAALVQQILANLISLLVALASLALFAGVVIIANTVALAMLERRREMGILKATGHSSRSVLTQVLIENGIVGGLGGVTGMAMVSVATAAAGRYLLKTDLGVGVPISLAVIAGVTILATLTAGLVAWGPTRVRPLEVLRYE
ncbi:MAG: ABC transporter permease [Candidatus Dormibacteria bacterium]